MIDDVNALRPRMMSVAYRMLGSVADAEDAVQDAFVRYQGGRRRLLAGGVPDPHHDAPVHRPAAGAPVNGIVELAGRRGAAHRRVRGNSWPRVGTPCAVVADLQARYFGAVLDDRGLNPGDSPRIGPTRFKDWIVGRND